MVSKCGCDLTDWFLGWLVRKGSKQEVGSVRLPSEKAGQEGFLCDDVDEVRFLSKRWIYGDEVKQKGFLQMKDMID